MTETAPPSDDPLDRPLADAERVALLDLPLPAVFSTVAADGSVHSVPIHFVFIDGEIRFIAEKGSVKVRNALRTGRATLCVTADVDGERRYVTVEGPVRIEDGLDQADLEALDLRYGRDSGSAADEEYADTVTLVVRPDRWLGRADSD
ncbi:MAG TPA: pyridoxamine 5'-phosphate oxidase family protein [Actinomycetota bacterium]|nr:pyridoxamine 5'-phosphate oxidase family protein [Actinomycetota bacterium]